MKKQFLLCLTLIFISLSSFAQNQAMLDSMERTLSTNVHDTIKLKTLGDLAWYYSVSNFDKSIEFGNKELALARKLKDEVSMAQAYSDLGNAYTLTGKYTEALNNYEESLKIRNKLGLKEKSAGSLSNIAVVYKQQAKFKEAGEYMIKALKVYEETGDEVKQAMVLGNLSGVLMNSNQRKEAKKYIDRGIKLASKNKVYPTLGNLYNSYVEYYFGEKQFDSAESYANRANEIFEAVGNYRDMAVILNSLGQIRVEQKRFAESMEYFEQSLDIRSQLGDQFGVASCHKNISFALNNLKRYDEAEKHIRISIAIFEKLDSKDYLQESYMFLMDIYQGRNDYKNALKYYAIAENIEDSILNKQTADKLTELQVLYETEKKEQQIQIQQLEITKRNIIILVVAFVLILTIVIAFLIYNRRKLKQDTRLQAEIIRQQDMASKGIIEAEERERKRIAGDLHDGIGQMFSAVRMNMSSIADHIDFKSADKKSVFDKTLDLVDESCKEVRVISHNMMPNVLLKSGLATAVREFINKIDSERLKVNLSTVGLNERLDNNTETVLYRVIQESVNNVIKHSKANQLDIQLIKEVHEITVMIEDNGIGFDSTKKEKFEGIGLKNIITRIEFLKGSVEWDSSPGKGTLVAIHVPNTTV